jgi:hypothetical protein
LAESLASIYLCCDAPPYPIVKACEDLGFLSPLDVRWARLSQANKDTVKAHAELTSLAWGAAHRRWGAGSDPYLWRATLATATLHVSGYVGTAGGLPAGTMFPVPYHLLEGRLRSASPVRSLLTGFARSRVPAKIAIGGSTYRQLKHRHAHDPAVGRLSGLLASLAYAFRLPWQCAWLRLPEAR